MLLPLVSSNRLSRHGRPAECHESRGRAAMPPAHLRLTCCLVRGRPGDDRRRTTGRVRLGSEPPRSSVYGDEQTWKACRGPAHAGPGSADLSCSITGRKLRTGLAPEPHAVIVAGRRPDSGQPGDSHRTGAHGRLSARRRPSSQRSSQASEHERTITDADVQPPSGSNCRNRSPGPTRNA